MHVERAQPKDLAAIQGAYERGRAIHREHGEVPWPAFGDEQLLAEMRAGGLFRVTDGDTLAGVFSVAHEDAQIWGELERGTHIYLHRITRADNPSGGSIVGAIVDWGLAQCDTLGREGLRMDATSTNAPLLAYYAKFGFDTVAKRLMPTDPALSPHYHGVELALLERPLIVAEQNSSA